jgi:voltage-dependent anion channel protein 2
LADLLNDDYTSSVVLKAKKNAGPVAVTIETTRGDDGALTSKVGTKFAYAKFNVDKGQIKADGGRVLETSLKVTPEVKLSFLASKGADLGVDYTKGNFYGTGVLDVMDMSLVSTSACYGLNSGLKVGGDAAYNLSGSKGLSGFNVGASYTAGPLFTSLTVSSKSAATIGLLYKVNSDLMLASQTVHTSNKVCDVLGVGAAFKAPVGTIKAKFNSGGVVSACLIREIAPKVVMTASGSVTGADFSTFKPGFQIAM